MNTRKIVIACLIVASVFVYFISTHVVGIIFDATRLLISRDYFLTIPEIISILIAAATFFLVYRSQKTMGFFSEVVTELTKVTCPTKKEAGQSAGVVLVLVAVAGILLAIFDVIWSFFTKFILG